MPNEIVVPDLERLNHPSVRRVIRREAMNPTGNKVADLHVPTYDGNSENVIPVEAIELARSSKIARTREANNRQDQLAADNARKLAEEAAAKQKLDERKELVDGLKKFGLRVAGVLAVGLIGVSVASNAINQAFNPPVETKPASSSAHDNSDQVGLMAGAEGTATPVVELTPVIPTPSPTPEPLPTPEPAAVAEAVTPIPTDVIGCTLDGKVTRNTVVDAGKYCTPDSPEAQPTTQVIATDTNSVGNDGRLLRNELPTEGRPIPGPIGDLIGIAVLVGGGLAFGAAIAKRLSAPSGGSDGNG